MPTLLKGPDLVIPKLDRMQQKVDRAKRALKTLQELVDSQSLTIVERDAAIQLN